MSQFNGKRFCEYKGVEQVSTNDKFLISHKNDDTYQTNSMTYATLKNYMKKRFDEMNNFGSMAYESKEKYAKIDHTHGNYSDFVYQNDIDEGQILAKVQSVYQNGDVSSYSIIRPKIEQEDVTYPENGQIRFVYSSYPLNSTLDDINSSNFDGWLLANGLCVEWSQITNEQLLETREYNYFTDGEYLHIPLLSNFLKVKPEPSSNTKVEFRSTVKPHQHTVKQATASTNIEIDTASENTKIINSKNANNTTAENVHYGKGTTTVMKLSVDMKISKEITVSFDDENSINKTELYPTHVSIPTLVYIGGAYSSTETFTVRFVDHDGSLMKTEDVTKGEDATPPENPQREGYVFDKWYGNYENVRKDEIVFATYTIRKITVTFDKQGGSGGTDSSTIEYNSAYTSIAVPSKTCCTFTGYYTEPFGKGYKIYNSDGTSDKIMDKTENFTLYANYNYTTHTVSLNVIPSDAGRVTGYGIFKHNEITTVNATAINGYTFDRWSDNGSAQHQITVDKSMELTAYFTKND